MAIENQRREDLLRDATTYPKRILFKTTSPASPPSVSTPTEDCQELFLGFRADGGWSIYFDEDPVYQFNSIHQLRRAYCLGQRYEAANGKLLHLQRTAQGGRVQLTRQALAENSAASLLAECQAALQLAARNIQSQQMVASGHVAQACSLAELSQQALDAICGVMDNLTVAQTAQAGGARP